MHGVRIQLMKKTNRKLRSRIQRLNLRKLRAGERRAGRLAKIQQVLRSSRKKLENERKKLRRDIYRNTYQGKSEAVLITEPLGLEPADGADHFLKFGEELLEFRGHDLTIDLANCDRVWPSGITLLCSLLKWIELTAVGHGPSVSSTRPSSDRVHQYLKDCGFYGFVKANWPEEANLPASRFSEVVPIRNEPNSSSIEEREKEIVDLLRMRSSLSEESIDLFDAKILTEVFNNVTEHGIAKDGDQGWWVLAQHHPRTRVISLCIADNGIGIKNTLITGPQKEEIFLKTGKENDKDGDFIQLALEKTVSGALDAPRQLRRLKAAKMTRGMVSPRYERGAHRGNGLRRIRDTCRDLRISFSITSHRGHVEVKETGEFGRIESRNGRLFGGTLYHFLIPCRAGEDHHGY